MEFGYGHPLASMYATHMTIILPVHSRVLVFSSPCTDNSKSVHLHRSYIHLFDAFAFQLLGPKILLCFLPITLRDLLGFVTVVSPKHPHSRHTRIQAHTHG